ncbi:MAG: SGNH/GDSL hydrolase family protein [Planctomycetes bacterium]|nr:SGNH/GDSL hydrolase family protein [Planctomycetota bacterium]
MSQSPLPLFVTRRGLPSVARKLEAGGPVNIAYFGGSITQAEGYRALTTAWIAGRYPRATVNEINAAIGGTGSDLGAFRLRQDVLRHRPDLMFVEYSVNDSGEGHDVTAAVEGIVRRTRRDLPGCDIAFVYTLAQGVLEDLRADRLPAAARRHEPVAEHYGLPSINVAVDVARRLDRGELAWTDFSHDSCHPSPRGHGLYAQTMAEALGEAFAVAPAAAGTVPAPLTPDPWEHGDMLTIDPKVHRFEGWEYQPMVNRGGWECFDGVLASQTPGHDAVFDFHGTVVGLYYHLGPETGDLLWSVDDAPLAPRRVFDSYAPKFWRPQSCVLTEGLRPGPHRLRLRVGPERDPSSTGSWARIAHVLYR